jgi:hypothetical protein
LLEETFLKRNGLDTCEKLHTFDATCMTVEEQLWHLNVGHRERTDYYI